MFATIILLFSITNVVYDYVFGVCNRGEYDLFIYICAFI